MTNPPSAERETNRTRMRAALITAARDLTIARGWEKVRMADVGAAVGVSRQTVYNEFDNKTGLAEALTAQEIRVFVTDVHRLLSEHGADVRAAGHAAIRHTLEQADINPLVRSILTDTHPGIDNLLPYLTTRAQAVLIGAGEVVRDWATQYLPDVDEAVIQIAAESIIRLVISHLVLASAPPAETADALADVLVRLLH